MTKANWRTLEIASLALGAILLYFACSLTACLALPVLASDDPRVAASTLLTDLKNLFDIIQTLVTAFAVLLGGIWTLILFQTRRQRQPRASLEHAVTCRKLPNGKILLAVSVMMSNASEVLLMCGQMKTVVQSVVPYDELAQKALVSWPNKSLNNDEKDVFEQWETIGFREHRWEKGKKLIEPGESHQFWFDFFIEPTVKTFRIHTHIREVDNAKLGWSLSSLHDLDISDTGTQIKNSEFTSLAASKPKDNN